MREYAVFAVGVDGGVASEPLARYDTFVEAQAFIDALFGDRDDYYFCSYPTDGPGTYEVYHGDFQIGPHF